MLSLLDKTKFDIEDFDDEIVLVNFQTGIYYTIKGSGPTILRRFQTGVDMDTLHQMVQTNFGAERQNEVRTFIDQLIQEGIIVAMQTEATGAGETELPVLIIDEAPIFEKFGDVSDLIKLDPIHDVSDLGWPHKK